MGLGFAVISPEVGGDAFFFKFSYLCFLVRQVKDAPLFHGHVVAGVQSGL
jgi:hypothetical protein